MFLRSSPVLRRGSERGLTLVEVMVSGTILTIVSLGILAALIQSRRMTEASIYQNSAVTAMQGYLEQMKNMEFNELPYYSGTTLMRGTVTTADDVIYTRLDNTTPDTLRISSGSIPSLATFIAVTNTACAAMTAGTLARTAQITSNSLGTGAIDNVKIIDVNNTTTAVDDLHLHIWVWISPLDNAGAGVSASRSITMVYAWMFNDGTRMRSGVDTVRTVRSAVPTF